MNCSYVGHNIETVMLLYGMNKFQSSVERDAPTRRNN